MRLLKKNAPSQGAVKTVHNGVIYLTCSESESTLELSFPKESCFPVFLSCVSTMKPRQNREKDKE